MLILLFSLLLSVAHAGPAHVGMCDLPPLLEFANGSSVVDSAGFQARQTQIRELLQSTLYGSLPTSVPSFLGSTVVSHVEERGSVREFVRLTFQAADNKVVSFTVEQIYSTSAVRPMPVFMTQTNHRRWALAAVNRGYFACVYPGADSDDQTDGFRLAYTNATWGLIIRRAWLGSRTIDYLVTLTTLVNASQIAVTGHSRNGKQSMLLAAFDDRISAVISSSSGAPAMSPYRFTSAYTFSEDPFGTWPRPPLNLNCSCPRDKSDKRPPRPECCWWPPAVADWSGRENENPIDSHGLLALIAPRFFLSQAAFTDECDPSFAVERTYVAAREVYRFLGHSERLRIHWRKGQHHGMEDIENYMDWFDYAFGRGSSAQQWPETLLFAFDWHEWNATTRHTMAPAESHPLVDRIQWALGTAPVAAGPLWSPGGEYGLLDFTWVDDMLRRGDKLFTPQPAPASTVTKMAINFSTSLYGYLYWVNTTAVAKGAALPVIIWLHPYSYQGGFIEDYHARSTLQTFDALAHAGFLVFTFDQVGFGHRISQGSRFYDRHASWSRLGRSVQDVMAAIDVLLSDKNGPHPDGLPISDMYGTWYPNIIQDRIVVAGYGLGGHVAVHAAALDPRIYGVAAVASLCSLRDSSFEHTHASLKRLYEWHAILPRLGMFVNNTTNGRFPYDYDDLLTHIGSRPSLVIAPTRDRTVDHSSVMRLLARATHANLTVLAPNDISVMDTQTQDHLIKWAKDIL